MFGERKVEWKRLEDKWPENNTWVVAYYFNGITWKADLRQEQYLDNLRQKKYLDNLFYQNDIWWIYLPPYDVPKLERIPDEWKE